jgi:exopolysaccharide production protein ExoZ
MKQAAGESIIGIQWLRAVGALMVVVHHARHSVPGSDAWPQFGAAGVDIFFVISGFVMAYTTRDSGKTGGTGSRIEAARDFFLRRVVRVVPLYWLVLLWTSRRDLIHGTVTADLVKDFAFVPHWNAIYPEMLWPTVIQGWTLNYEMFFYLIFALSLLLGRLSTIVVMGVLIGLVTFGIAVSGSLQLNSSSTDVVRHFYTDSIILEFCYGILLQYGWAAKRYAYWPRTIYILILMAGFALLAVGYGRAPRGIVEGIPALVIVWAGIYACAGLRSRVLGLLGDASYSIYLVHWASFGAAKPIVALITNQGQSLPLEVQVALLMTIHIFIAILSGIAIHLTIEKPLLRWTQDRFGLTHRKLEQRITSVKQSPGRSFDPTFRPGR